MCFELQELHSIDEHNTFLITVLEGFAQAESESRSKNIKWGIERGLKNPNSRLYNRICFGYRLGEDGVLTIEENEAETVRMIFKLYLEDYSILAILREFEQLAIKSPTGKERWSKRTIDTILSNEKYAGHVIRGKSFMEPYPSSKKRVNHGEMPQSHLENNHPPIIDQEHFDKVQAEKQRRSNVQNEKDGKKRRSTHYSMKQHARQKADSLAESHEYRDIEE